MQSDGGRGGYTAGMEAQSTQGGSAAAAAGPAEARWWAIRRAKSFKPVSYTCPLCSLQLHAMTDHVLLTPEGDVERRRHAHSACVRSARARGRLPSRDEWEATQPRRAGRLGRLFGRSG